MRKIFTMLATLLVAMGMSATTTFTFKTDEKQTKDGFTVEVAQAAGQNPPKIYNDTLRLYAQNTITVKGSKITSLKITFAKQGKKEYAEVEANVGTYVSGGKSTDKNDPKVDTWSGDAQEVVITLGAKGQRIITALEVSGEGGGTDEPITDNTKITGMTQCDAYYWRWEYDEETVFPIYDFDMYKGFDYETGYVYPEVYLQVMANSKTAINGTYDLLYAGIWTSATDSVEISDEEDAVGTVTIKNTDNNGNYSFTGTFTGTDGKLYTFESTVAVEAMDDDEGTDITLNENGGGTEPAGSLLTCAEAATIAAQSGYKGTENVTVFGYVTELGNQKTDKKTGRTKQCFYMSDAQDGAKTFMAYWALVPNFFEVGDRVQVTGILQNYDGTIEIADGEATLYTEDAVENTEVATKSAEKVIENGQLIIIRNHVRYNAVGAMVR